MTHDSFMMKCGAVVFTQDVPLYIKFMNVCLTLPSKPNKQIKYSNLVDMVLLRALLGPIAMGQLISILSQPGHNSI